MFPVESRSQYEYIATQLGLPPVYLHYFARRQATPVVVMDTEVDGRPRIGWLLALDRADADLSRHHMSEP